MDEDEFCPRKGVERALDHIDDSFDSVACGIAHWLHDGWGHSYPAGHCRHRVGNPGYSGTKEVVAIWTLAGEAEVFGRGRSEGPERFCQGSLCWHEKGFVIDHFTTNLRRETIAMKKERIVIHFLAFLMLIATLAACASTRTHESAGEYVDDSVITSKVKSLLAADDFLKSFQISVETFQGTVQLSGFVNSQKAVDRAGEIARSVQGVKSIKNDLIVK
jgi:hypothetical protein